MKPVQRIEQVLNYSLYNQIPNKWKACKLYFEFKENGFKPESRDRFSIDLSHFFETRTRSNEGNLFYDKFQIRLTSELMRECVLHYGDICVDPKKIKQITQNLITIFISLWPEADLLMNHELISQALMSMYQIHYYDKTGYFTYSRLKSEILYQTEKLMSKNGLDDLLGKLDSLDPDQNEITPKQKNPLPSLASHLTRDDEIDSIPEFHSLTQAELDWLNELATPAPKVEFSTFPKIRGTAVKSDSEYPEAIRSLLKTTREYDLKVGKSKRVSMDLKLRIQNGIRSVAREILGRYRKPHSG